MSESVEPFPRFFDVPWRVRDPLYAIFWTYASGVLILMAMGIGYGVFCVFNGIPLNEHLLEGMFTAPPWPDIFSVMELLLWVFFLSVFVFRSGRFSPARMFAPKQAAWEARYSVRMFFLSILFSLLLGLFVSALIVVAARLLGHNPGTWHAAYDRQMVKEALSRATPESGWFRVLFVVALAPPVEELLFRGIFYGALRKRLSPWPANPVSSALFTLLHGYLVGIPFVFLLGILMAWVYERTRSLTAPILVHVLWNLLKVCMMKPVLWPVLAVAVAALLLWGARARGASPFDSSLKRSSREMAGWKVYAFLFTVFMMMGNMEHSHAAFYMLAEIPVYLAVFSYAYRKTWLPVRAWEWYGIFYVGYIVYSFWSLWGDVKGHGLGGAVFALALNGMVMLPSLIILWRLTRPRVDAVSSPVLE